MSYEESHSAQDNLRNVSQRSDFEMQRIRIDSDETRYILFAAIRVFTSLKSSARKLFGAFISQYRYHVE